MAVEVFDFPVLANETGEQEYVTRTAQFGDSYAQVSGEGINERKRTWSIAYAGKLEKVLEVKAFLDARKGYQSFIWKDPLGELGLYRATRVQVLPYSKDVFRLTTTFEEAFAP